MQCESFLEHQQQMQTRKGKNKGVIKSESSFQEGMEERLSQ